MSSSTNAGDPSAANIPVGYIKRAHGIKGAVVVRSLTDDPERFAVGQALDTDNPRHPRLEVESVQVHRDGLLVGLVGIEDRSSAEELRGTSFLIDVAERRQLADDEFWPDQLIGLRVEDAAAIWLGRVIDVVGGEAQQRLVVENRIGEYAVPFVAAIVIEVDVTGGRVVVDPPPGLVPGYPGR